MLHKLKHVVIIMFAGLLFMPNLMASTTFKSLAVGYIQTSYEEPIMLLKIPKEKVQNTATLYVRSPEELKNCVGISNIMGFYSIEGGSSDIYVSELLNKSVKKEALSKAQNKEACAVLKEIEGDSRKLKISHHENASALTSSLKECKSLINEAKKYYCSSGAR